MITDEATGAHTLLFLILDDNGISPDPQVCNATSMINMPEIDKTEDVVYQLTISGQMRCEHLVGNDTCASNKIDQIGDSWNAYGVDDWYGEWYDTRQGDFKDKGMMTLFGESMRFPRLWPVLYIAIGIVGRGARGEGVRRCRSSRRM